MCNSRCPSDYHHYDCQSQIHLHPTTSCWTKTSISAHSQPQLFCSNPIFKTTYSIFDTSRCLLQSPFLILSLLQLHVLMLSHYCSLIFWLEKAGCVVGISPAVMGVIFGAGGKPKSGCSGSNSGNGFNSIGSSSSSSSSTHSKCT